MDASLLGSRAGASPLGSRPASAVATALPSVLVCHSCAHSDRAAMSLSKPQGSKPASQASPGSPTKEELEELAARSNAVLEKGLHQLEEEEGGWCARAASSQQRRPRAEAIVATRRRHPPVCCVSLWLGPSTDLTDHTPCRPPLSAGTKPLGTATSLAAQRAPRDPDGESYSRTWSEVGGPPLEALGSWMPICAHGCVPRMCAACPSGCRRHRQSLEAGGWAGATAVLPPALLFCSRRSGRRPRSW